MEEITLRYFNTGGLSFGFARDLDNGKVKQYIVAASSLPFDKTVPVADQARSVLEDYLEKEIGKPVRVNIENPLDVEMSRPTVKVAPIFNTVTIRPKSTKTLKALRKIKTENFLYQYNKNETLFTRFVIAPLNYVIRFINRKIEDIYITSQSRKLPKGVDLFELAELGYLERLTPPFRIPTIYNPAVRAVEPVLSIAVMVGEEDLNRGLNELLDDLDSLNRHGLLMGNLLEPQIMKAANTTGTKRNVYILFALPIVNVSKGIEENLLSNMGLPWDIQLMAQCGLNHIVPEGSVSFLDNKVDPPYTELVAETVDISPDQEQIWKKTQDAFNETLESIRKVAKKKTPVN